MVEDFRFTTRGGATAAGIGPAAPQQCLRTGRWSSAMLTGSLRLMEISAASSRHAMTTDFDAVAGIKTRARKSVYRYGFCYGEEREAERKSRQVRNRGGTVIEIWAWVELNYRPHAYQACALTT